MIDLTAIARCHRCNVISTPLYPITSDPTHAAVTIPHDWMGVRIFMDGEQDFLFCPSCTRDAWDWINTKQERFPTDLGTALPERELRKRIRNEAAEKGWDKDFDTAVAPRNEEDRLALWERELLGRTDEPLYMEPHACQECGTPTQYVWCADCLEVN